jgi:hypothetical protein
MRKGSDRGLDWVGLPVIATVARLLVSSSPTRAKRRS